MNLSLNATLPRIVLTLEKYLKKRSGSPSPAIRLPPTGFSIDTSSDDVVEPAVSPVGLKCWSMDDPDADEATETRRAVLQTSFDPSEAEYRAAVYIKPLVLAPSEEDESTPMLSSSSLPGGWSALSRTRPSLGGDGTPRPISIPSSPSQSSDASSKSKPFGWNPINPTSTLQRRLHESVSVPDLKAPAPRTIRHTPSHSSSHSRTSVSSSATIMETDGQRASRKVEVEKNFVVAEVIVGTESFPAGYNVMSEAFLVPKPVRTGLTSPSNAADTTSPSPAPLSLDLSTLTERLPLPLQVHVISLPPPTLHSASLLSAAPARRSHLVRFTLPTSIYTSRPAADPLQAGPKPPLKKPAWLNELEARGGIVMLRIDPLAGEPYDEPDQVIVAVQGSLVEVQGRPAMTPGASVSTLAEEVASTDSWPVIRRYIFSSSFCPSHLS